MTTTLYIDIEGDYSHPTEVGLILVDREKPAILKAEVLYGKIYDFLEFKRGRRFCHGMSRTFLDEHGLTWKCLVDSVKHLIGEWKPKEIVSHGRDCLLFCACCNVNLPWREVNLPCWIDRDKEKYHQIAFDYKRRNALIENTFSSCRQDVVHPGRLEQGQHPIKLKHGAHCALYDSLEIALFENEKLPLMVNYKQPFAGFQLIRF